MPGSAPEGSHRLHLAALLRPVPCHVWHQEQHSLRLRFVVQPEEASTTEGKSEQHIMLETLPGRLLLRLSLLLQVATFSCRALVSALPPGVRQLSRSLYLQGHYKLA